MNPVIWEPKTGDRKSLPTQFVDKWKHVWCLLSCWKLSRRLGDRGQEEEEEEKEEWEGCNSQMSVRNRVKVTGVTTNVYDHVACNLSFFIFCFSLGFIIIELNSNDLRSELSGQSFCSLIDSLLCVVSRVVAFLFGRVKGPYQNYVILVSPSNPLETLS